MRATTRRRTRSGAPREGESTAPSDSGFSPAEVLRLLHNEYAPFPWHVRYDPASEIVFTILSQHTSDHNSELAFKRLMDTLGSLEEVARADTELIAQCINVGGLARIKAPRIKQVLNLIMERVGSLDLYFLKEMPLAEAKAWLRELPGIGPKSAAVILCFALGMPAMAVDTHIYRVAKRVGLIGPKTSYELAHEILERAVAPEEIYPFHMSLITHGRRVCKAPRPLCAQCVLAFRCPSKHLGDAKPKAGAAKSPGQPKDSKPASRGRSR
jgi:endonuclease-3